MEPGDPRDDEVVLPAPARAGGPREALRRLQDVSPLHEVPPLPAEATPKRRKIRDQPPITKRRNRRS